VNNNTVVDADFTGGRNYELLNIKDYADNDNNLRPNQAALNTRNQTPTAFLDLTQLLPILKAQPYVLGNELRSLRLVVEWAPHSTEAEIAKFAVGKKGGGAPTLEILKPTLLLDEVTDPSAASKLKNKRLTYVNLDHEIVNVPIDKLSVRDLRLRAFDDKFVRRMLFMNEETVIDANETDAGSGRFPSTYFGGFACYATPGDKLQWKINGSKFLPYDGITNENQKLAMLNDVWGNFLCPQGAQYQNLLSRHLLFDKHDVTDDVDVLVKTTEQHNLCGQMSYGGLQLNSKVEEMLLEYSRSPSGLMGNSTVQTVVIGNPTKIYFYSAHNIIDQSTVLFSGFTDTSGAGGSDWTPLNGDKVATVVDDISITIPDDSSALTGHLGVPVASVSTKNNNTKVRRAHDPFNLLFWGEVVQTMSVSNNRVVIGRA
jgi:hypothetical protein